MSQPSVSIDQLLASLQRRGVPMAFEMGTFLVLEATERLIATMPVVVTAAEVWLSDDGELLVATQGVVSSEREACRALIMLLGDLLVRSAPGVPPMLLHLVERGPSEGDWRLARLRDDLEASLVPLNRGATRRVLARLLRDAKRDVERSVAPPPDEGAVDRELDEMLGLPSAAAPQRNAPAATPARAPISHPRPRAYAPPEPESEPEPEPEAQDTPSLDGAEAEQPQRAPKRGRRESLDDFEHAAAGHGGSGARIGAWLLLLTAALVVAYVVVGRDGVRKLLGLGSTEPAQTALASAPVAPSALVQRYGELRVTSTPPKAQVLLRVGEGPVIVPKLPLGVAHEFVAMQPGMAPSRAVVPPEAKWAQEGSELRYELALQLGAAAAHVRDEDLGPTRLTQDVGRPSGALGSVRVITAPPGASVYQVIGFTPDVSVQNMPIDQPVDLLVFLPGHALSRVRVTAADWKRSATGLLAEPVVTLTPDKR